MSPPVPLDVVRLVLDLVDSPSTLAALALTNRHVSKFALDRLWRRLDNLYFLAKCMPEELLKEHKTTAVASNQIDPSLTVTIQPSYLGKDVSLGSRFYEYADRVHEIALTEYPAPWKRIKKFGRPWRVQVDKSVLELWLISSIQKPLFPGLRSVSINRVWLNMPFYAHLLNRTQCHPLTKVDVLCRRSEIHIMHTSWKDVISTLPSGNPNLEVISLDDVYPSVIKMLDPEWTIAIRWSRDSLRECTPRFAAVLPQLHHLRSISTSYTLSGAVLQQIATFPHLEVLKCQVAICNLNSALESFSSLREITCYAHDVDVLVSFLDAIKSARLEAIHFTQREFVTEHQLARLFFVLGLHPSRNSLRAVCLRKYYQTDYEDIRAGSQLHTVTSPQTLFAPLLGMPRLSVLIFPLIRCFLSDELVCQLCNLLPALSYIKFREKPCLSFSTLNTLFERAFIAQYPPFILRMSSISNFRPNSLDQQPAKWSPPKITELFVDSIPDCDLEVLANILVYCFPNLENVVEANNIGFDIRVHRLNPYILAAREAHEITPDQLYQQILFPTSMSKRNKVRSYMKAFFGR